jgi:uncharacterized protein (PEP-CTERM system associated)
MFRPNALVYALAVAAASAPPAYALDWRFEPTLSAAATYTDNVNQSANDPQNALVLSATPGFTLRSEGSHRVQASLQYDLRGVTRFADDTSDSFHHNLSADGKAELIEDLLFIDGSARVSQELISLLGSTADAEINDDNRATVGTYSISPYIQKRLGTFAEARARYTLSGAMFEEDATVSARDTTVNAFTAGLASGTRFDEVTWGLNYSIRKADNRDAAADTTFERATASLGYALTRKFRLFGTVGQDWNEYPSVTETSGSSYSVGFGWAPSRRTSIEASVGERYFGPTYNASAQHRTRMTHWSLSYVEDVTDTAQFLPTAGTQYLVSCSGGPPSIWLFKTPPPPECDILGVRSGPVVDLRSGVFIGKTMRAGVSIIVRKLTYSLTYADLKRLYTALDAEDQTQSLGATVTYRMTPKTSLTGGLGFTRIHVPAPLAVQTRDDDLVSLSVGVSHRFAEKLTGALSFRHTQRDSNDATAVYDENNITASVNMRF